MDILDKLKDLHKQATEERSHYYAGSVVSEAIAEIQAMRGKWGDGRVARIRIKNPSKHRTMKILVNGDLVELDADCYTDYALAEKLQPPMNSRRGAERK